MLSEIVERYLHLVSECSAQLARAIAHDEPLRAWHRGEIPRSGVLRTFATYSFHGCGCQFEGESGWLVDFDFIDDLAVFDVWRLAKFAESIGSECSKGSIADALDSLCQSGHLKKFPDTAGGQYGLRLKR